MCFVAINVALGLGQVQDCPDASKVNLKDILKPDPYHATRKHRIAITVWISWSKMWWLCQRWNIMIKIHVHGFFDTDLHEVSWHFATGSKFNWQSESSVREPIQNGFLFLSHTKKSKYGYLILSKLSWKSIFPRRSPWHLIVFGALPQVPAVGHCLISQERDLLWANWPKWWVWPWVPAFEKQLFLSL